MLIDDPGVDCSTWRVLALGLVDGQQQERRFELTTVFGDPGDLLGYGAQRVAWVVFVERGETALVEVGGRRLGTATGL